MALSLISRGLPREVVLFDGTRTFAKSEVVKFVTPRCWGRVTIAGAFNEPQVIMPCIFDSNGQRVRTGVDGLNVTSINGGGSFFYLSRGSVVMNLPAGHYIDGVDIVGWQTENIMTAFSITT